MNTNRIYGHQELALLYFPNVLPSSASTQLTRFIRRDPPSHALASADHRRSYG